LGLEGLWEGHITILFHGVGKMNEEVRAAGVKQEVRVVLVDAGYYSEENVLKADPEGPDLLLATSKDRKQR